MKNLKTCWITYLNFKKSRKENGQRIGPILLFVDDLFVSSTRGSRWYSQALARIAATGRRLKFLCILIAQRWESLSPSIRSQCSIYITFKPRSTNERKMIIREFLSRENSISRSETNKKRGKCLRKFLNLVIENSGLWLLKMKAGPLKLMSRCFK